MAFFPSREAFLYGGGMCPLNNEEIDNLQDPLCILCARLYSSGKAFAIDEVPEGPIRLPCGHIFGSECVLRWTDCAQASGATNACPLCKRVLFPSREYLPLDEDAYLDAYYPVGQGHYTYFLYDDPEWPPIGYSSVFQDPFSEIFWSAAEDSIQNPLHSNYPVHPNSPEDVSPSAINRPKDVAPCYSSNQHPLQTASPSTHPEFPTTNWIQIERRDSWPLDEELQYNPPISPIPSYWHSLGELAERRASMALEPCPIDPTLEATDEQQSRLMLQDAMCEFVNYTRQWITENGDAMDDMSSWLREGI